MPLPSPFLIAFVAELMSCGMDYPFGQFGSAVLIMSPPKIFPRPAYTFLATNAKHSTVRAAMRKINSISARHSREANRKKQLYRDE